MLNIITIILLLFILYPLQFSGELSILWGLLIIKWIDPKLYNHMHYTINGLHLLQTVVKASTDYPSLFIDSLWCVIPCMAHDITDNRSCSYCSYIFFRILCQLLLDHIHNIGLSSVINHPLILIISILCLLEFSSCEIKLAIAIATTTMQPSLLKLF